MVKTVLWSSAWVQIAQWDIDITAAQLKTANSIPVVVVPGQVGWYFEGLACSAQYKPGEVAFSAAQGIALTLNGLGLFTSTDSLGFDALTPQVALLTPGDAIVGDLDDLGGADVLFTAGGDPGGSGTGQLFLSLMGRMSRVR